MTGTTVGAPARFTAYACSPVLENGREAIYRITRPTTGAVTLDLAANRDLDLIVLAEGAGGGCAIDQTGCVAARSTAATNETLTFTAQAGVPYYVVVDGYGTSAGGFTLSATCP